jgi:hypothetical protein
MSAWKLWKQMFDAWEGATSEYLEKVMRSPTVLEPGAAWLTAMMKLKAGTDQATAGFWGSLGLPTKRDQERTLHLLQQLQSRLIDLEERLEDAERRALEASRPDPDTRGRAA